MLEPRDRSVAILCSGPSLATFIAMPKAHDVFIGVNRAVEAYRCDWWCFNDAPTLSLFDPIGHPQIFTSKACEMRVEDQKKLQQFERTYFHAINTTCRSDPGWDNFSMTCAMVLAEHLGATHITIYGCDWSGTSDWDGRPCAATGRSEYRWKNEMHKYGHVAKWLESRGVGLTRMVLVNA